MVGPIVAHVRFRGTIRERSVEPYLKILSYVREKPKIRGLLMDVSSGGGDGVSSTDLYNAVKRVSKVKPVVATVGSVAASGGYMALLGANKIYAHEESDVGSIGVFIPHISLKKLLEKIGVEVELLHHGEHKDAYQGLRPLTPEEKAKLLAVARVGYDSFVDMVARERKIPRDRMLTLATGEYWSGKQAKELGLIDAIGDREDAIAELSRVTGVAPRKVVEFAPPQPFLSRLMNRGGMFSLGGGMATDMRNALEEVLEDALLSGGRVR